jgi:hypothetical protein
MASQKFVIDLPSGTEFSIEEFVREVNKRYKSEYSVRAKETEQRDLVPAMIQQIHKRITGIEDYLNDWTESQLRTNKIVTDQCAILGQKVTEIDQWSNTVVEETNRVIHEINTHDPEGTRKYMFGVIDNIVKEINNQREAINQILDFVSSDALTERAIKNIEQLEATFQKEQQQPQKRGRGRPRKTDAPKIKLSKNDIKKAKEEYEKLEAAQQPSKRGRGRPRKDQQVTKSAPVNPQKKKRGRPKKTEKR